MLLLQLFLCNKCHGRIVLVKIIRHFLNGGNVSIISVGWDPGMFSLNRLYAEAILPQFESSFNEYSMICLFPS